MYLFEIKTKRVICDGNTNQIWYEVWKGERSKYYDEIEQNWIDCFDREKIEYEGNLFRDEIPEGIQEQTNLIKEILIEENNLKESDFIC